MPASSNALSKIKPVVDLSPDGRLKAARLVQSALPAYYITLTPSRADALVCAEFAEIGTELEHCLAAVDGQKVIGIVCTYAMDELAERQYRSFQLVARSLNRDEFTAFADHLRRLRAGLPSITGEGTYLGFIAVDPAERGSGVADKLMARAIAAAGCEPLMLTVRNDNYRARAFYERQNFTLVTEAGEFSLLKREVPACEASTLA